MSLPKLSDIEEDFELLDEWDDRYRYLIELGEGLEPLADDERNAQTKVQGCVSQVWLVASAGQGSDPVITFRGDSDAHIVRGLVAVALAAYSDRKASEIAKADPDEVFGRLDLSEHITPQRSNGLRAMIRRIKGHAEAALAH